MIQPFSNAYTESCGSSDSKFVYLFWKFLLQFFHTWLHSSCCMTHWPVELSKDLTQFLVKLTQLSVHVLVSRKDHNMILHLIAIWILLSWHLLGQAPDCFHLPICPEGELIATLHLHSWHHHLSMSESSLARSLRATASLRRPSTFFDGGGALSHKLSHFGLL